jgi:protein-S-isoprenylcysteine O-methyltransferase Ste14
MEGPLETLRYVLALLVVVATPPGILLWFVIHPLARFWRRVGWGWTYGVLAPPSVGLMVGLFLLRRPLLAAEYGTSYALAGLGVVAIGLASAISWKRRRHLTTAILAGLPELSPGSHPPRLLTEGLYARIRHPRYVEVALFVLGYALVSNYLAGYVTFALSLPAIYAVVVLEERELRERFGREYEEYCRRVPRFFPRPRQSG